jgi:hypothetical protein
VIALASSGHGVVAPVAEGLVMISPPMHDRFRIFETTNTYNASYGLTVTDTSAVGANWTAGLTIYNSNLTGGAIPINVFGEQKVEASVVASFTCATIGPVNISINFITQVISALGVLTNTTTSVSYAHYTDIAFQLVPLRFNTGIIRLPAGQLEQITITSTVALADAVGVPNRITVNYLNAYDDTYVNDCHVTITQGASATQQFTLEGVQMWELTPSLNLITEVKANFNDYDPNAFNQARAVFGLDPRTNFGCYDYAGRRGLHQVITTGGVTQHLAASASRTRFREAFRKGYSSIKPHLTKAIQSTLPAAASMLGGYLGGPAGAAASGSLAGAIIRPYATQYTASDSGQGAFITYHAASSNDPIRGVDEISSDGESGCCPTHDYATMVAATQEYLSGRADWDSGEPAGTLLIIPALKIKNERRKKKVSKQRGSTHHAADVYSSSSLLKTVEVVPFVRFLPHNITLVEGVVNPETVVVGDTPGAPEGGGAILIHHAADDGENFPDFEFDGGNQMDDNPVELAGELEREEYFIDPSVVYNVSCRTGTLDYTKKSPFNGKMVEPKLSFKLAQTDYEVGGKKLMMYRAPNKDIKYSSYRDCVRCQLVTTVDKGTDGAIKGGTVAILVASTAPLYTYQYPNVVAGIRTSYTFSSEQVSGLASAGVKYLLLVSLKHVTLRGIVSTPNTLIPEIIGSSFDLAYSLIARNMHVASVVTGAIKGNQIFEVGEVSTKLIVCMVVNIGFIFPLANYKPELQEYFNKLRTKVKYPHDITRFDGTERPTSDFTISAVTNVYELFKSSTKIVEESPEVEMAKEINALAAEVLNLDLKKKVPSDDIEDFMDLVDRLDAKKASRIFSTAKGKPPVELLISGKTHLMDGYTIEIEAVGKQNLRKSYLNQNKSAKNKQRFLDVWAFWDKLDNPDSEDEVVKEVRVQKAKKPTYTDVVIAKRGTDAQKQRLEEMKTRKDKVQEITDF